VLDVLRHLAAHANKTVMHREVLQAVWGPDYGEAVDSLRIIVSQLRKKIDIEPAHPISILTELWVGDRPSTSRSIEPRA
jgi:two-component system KDP operon response regulator KdpE